MTADQPLPGGIAETNDLEAAVDAALAACDGDLRATIRALIVANSFLTEQVDTLTKELDWAWHWISPGYTRSTNQRRMKSGDPE
ncbi:MAG: hypothetical protein QOF14_5769 [Hyphomicrobiales bacterium]|jgi:hypothetical protein|nr:hypothetical protein [Hyphomicrobiales bacterium]